MRFRCSCSAASCTWTFSSSSEACVADAADASRSRRISRVVQLETASIHSLRSSSEAAARNCEKW